MRFRTQSPRGKHNLVLLDSARVPVSGKKVQLRLQDYVGIAGGELLLKEHAKGQYAEYVEGNTYSISQDGVLQSSLSPICVPDPAEFIDLVPAFGAPDSGFGDGSDGDVVIESDDGITRDMFYHDLIVPEGITLGTNNWRIFVSGTLYCWGIISNKGGDALGNAGGTNPASGYFLKSPNGVNGGLGGLLGAQGTRASAGENMLAGVIAAGVSNTGPGGSGGDRDNHTSPPGGIGGDAGLAGTFGLLTGASSYKTRETGELGRIISFAGVARFSMFSGNGAGGGGGGGTPGPGGGGSPGNGGDGGGAGANGGIVFIACRRITGTGGINARGGLGGDGANGGSSVSHYGGGGGGGGGGNSGNGGLIYVVYNELLNNIGPGLLFQRSESPGRGGELGQGGIGDPPYPDTNNGYPGTKGQAGALGIHGAFFTFCTESSKISTTGFS